MYDNYCLNWVYKRWDFSYLVMTLDKHWEIYLVECLDGSLYTGVTNDVAKRMDLHSSGKGSKYVRAKGFSKLVARKDCLDKSDACKKEYFVKKLSRNEKIEWFKYS